MKSEWTVARGKRKAKEMDSGLAEAYRTTGRARFPRGQRWCGQDFPSLRLEDRMWLQEGRCEGYR